MVYRCQSLHLCISLFGTCSGKSARAGDARGETLLHRTEEVAEAHSAHPQLFDLCEYLADRERLCQHMSAGGFCSSMVPVLPSAGLLFSDTSRLRLHLCWLAYWLSSYA